MHFNVGSTFLLKFLQLCINLKKVLFLCDSFSDFQNAPLCSIECRIFSQIYSP